MPTDGVVRIAMWSGPRNISTAMMRSFENRPDTVVVDEPFYGYYLKRTGVDHPGRDEIVAAMDCDWRSVAEALTRETPAPCRTYYQKHMTHHMLDEVDLEFTSALTNCFLVRDPARMIASYAKVRPTFTLADLGLPQQLRIFEYVRAATGKIPLVVEAAEVLADPRRALRRLCAHVGIDFDERMLRWPAGTRPSDGVWAPYWYAAVVRSTGFQAQADEPIEVPRDYADIYAEALEIYRALTSS
jgi:Sulfotransferase domain